MNVRQIIPCTDWFYVGDTEKGEIVLRVAAWAITDGEDVIGLLADQKMAGMPSLSAPDSEWIATYKHLRELTQYQCQLAREQYIPH